jgi:hypothetical protein
VPQTIQIVPSGPGNTLIIPTQDRLIEPYQTPYLFGDFTGCLGGVSIDFSCNCVFHDANTHLMFTVAACGAGAGGCVTGNIDLPGGCAAVERCQARVDAMAGVRLDATEYLFDGFPTAILNPFPAWLLSQLSPEQIALGYLPDWWAVFCDPIVVTIPGYGRSIPASCPAGTAIDALGVCKAYDPPVPFPLKDITSMVPRTPPPTSKPQKIFLPNPNPIELSGVAPWPLPQVIMAPECTSCMTGEDGEEEAI